MSDLVAPREIHDEENCGEEVGDREESAAIEESDGETSGPLSGQDHGVRVGDDVLKKRTGKTWAEWFPILDKAGAKKMNHTEIATVLHEKFGVPEWWCQMIAVGYEHSRGLRELHESCGGFSASVSRTLGVAVKPLFAACADDKKRGAWLKWRQVGSFYRTSRKNRPRRVGWRKPTRDPLLSEGSHENAGGD